MDIFITEQLKVNDMLKRINPMMEANYESMIQSLKKVNPMIQIEKISRSYKRIMYLQLVAHSVTEGCKKMIEATYDNRKIEEIHHFQKSVESYCKGFTDGSTPIDDEEMFNQNQIIASDMFVAKWNEITQCLSLHAYQEVSCFVQ